MLLPALQYNFKIPTYSDYLKIWTQNIIKLISWYDTDELCLGVSWVLVLISVKRYSRHHIKGYLAGIIEGPLCLEGEGSKGSR